jgi:Schitoviridae RNA polymerase
MFQTFTAREYLKIDIANNFGHDKLTWADRIQWFDAHEQQLEDLIQGAKEPALYYAGCKAWRDVQQGKPIGYMISLDATSSGLQLLAALTGDRWAAELCNVVDTGSREDAYTTIYHDMLGQIGEGSKISRDDTKQAIMTAFYSSKAVPKQVFGEGSLLDVFYDTLSNRAPGAWELNEEFVDLWDPTALEHSWILPDNFHVHIKVMSRVRETVHFLNAPYDVFYNENQPTDEGRSLGANTIHSIDGMIVREMIRHCDYDVFNIARCWELFSGFQGTETKGKDNALVAQLWAHYKASGYLSARILTHLSPKNIGLVNHQVIKDLLVSLPDRPFKVISVHDCFRCLPRYANDLRRQYNIQLQLIAKSNMLTWLLSQVAGRNISITKLDPTLSSSIADTNYALS